MDLLFTDAFLHALCMLRMHTTFTLDVMDLEVTRLGRELRRFVQVVCPCYKTVELPKEKRSRQRKAIIHDSSAGGKRKRTLPEDLSVLKKDMPLNTYKLHILGHYRAKIEGLGTTDNYNTKTVSVSLSSFLAVTLIDAPSRRLSMSNSRRCFVRVRTIGTGPISCVELNEQRHDLATSRSTWTLSRLGGN